MRKLVTVISDEMMKLVMVCEYTPIHADKEKVTQEDEFIGDTVIGIPSYNVLLNTKDERLGVAKAAMKSRMVETFEIMMVSASVVYSI